MKKEYTKPAAEKVAFDYTEVVVACSGIDDTFVDSLYGGKVYKVGGQYYYNGRPIVNEDPYGQYHKCRSTDHHTGCEQF